ncbi:MAG: DUF4158 domain-containing protein [Rhodospirillales bacterium]|nr:DUF4158 domain-containing protein [Rhodospirillales bacterium]
MQSPDFTGGIFVQFEQMTSWNKFMPRRTILILTDRQRALLLNLPIDDPARLIYYTLANDGLAHLWRWRRPENQPGFTLQHCALRYSGRRMQMRRSPTMNSNADAQQCSPLNRVLQRDYHNRILPNVSAFPWPL